MLTGWLTLFRALDAKNGLAFLHVAGRKAVSRVNGEIVGIGLQEVHIACESAIEHLGCLQSQLEVCELGILRSLFLHDGKGSISQGQDNAYGDKYAETFIQLRPDPVARAVTDF